VAWIAVLAIFFVLMRGGVAGLTPVETARWGGVPLTMLLSTLSIAAGFPIAVLVALGRRSHLPAIRSMCIVYVELIRGVPLISVLFMASFMFPLSCRRASPSTCWCCVLVGITLFSAAYRPKSCASGLQAIPKVSTKQPRRWAFRTGKPSARSSCRRHCAWWSRRS
jgi:general L-amino acid transport system permease protein